LACDTRHLSQSAYRIAHEVNDELGEGRVEFTLGKRQLFSGCDAYLHSGMGLPDCGDELLRRIDRRDRCRSESVGEFGRQRTWTATSSTRLSGAIPAKSANDGAS